MAKTIKALKEISTMAAAALDISYKDAARLVAVYSAAGDWVTVDAVERGDHRPLIKAAADLGVEISAERIAAYNKAPAPDPLINKDIPAAAVSGAVVGDAFEGVPAALLDLVSNCIESACIQYKIDDLCKASAERWRAVCMYTGRHIKQSKLLMDVDRVKRDGGSIYYIPERVEALLSVWVEYCAAFDKAPMACDFIAFSGVSPNWFYDNNGARDLSSSRVHIAQKLNDLQEAGLAVRLADGRRNPTGQIFILKNLHGWRDQREIIHNDAGNGSTVATLPVFNNPGLPKTD